MSLRNMSRICIRAVQGLKDQSSSKGMMSGFKSSQARPTSESGASTQMRWVSGAVDHAKKGSTEEKRRIREAEKAEKVMHLICWGPN